jgi:hypothetical protein
VSPYIKIQLKDIEIQFKDSHTSHILVDIYGIFPLKSMWCEELNEGLTYL